MTNVVAIRYRKAAWPRLGVYKTGPAGPWFVPSKSNEGRWHRNPDGTFTECARRAGEFNRVDFGHDPKVGIFFTCDCHYGERHERMDLHNPPRPHYVRPNVVYFLDRCCSHVTLSNDAEQLDGFAEVVAATEDDLSRFYE